MRLFLAIELSQDVRGHLVRVQNTLRPIARASYTVAENLHVTLKFLGEVADKDVMGVCDALAKMDRAGDFAITMEGLACFPGHGPVRIIGAEALTIPQPLQTLAARVEETCAALGFAPEGRRYRPHVTLARARDGLHPRMRRTLAEAVAKIFPGPQMLVQEFVLMESRLGPNAPQYTPIARIAVST